MGADRAHRRFHLAESYPGRRCPVRNRAWNAQVHFRARSDLAPDIESRADLFGALAHARQTPVSITSRVQELRVDALSIIPDAQPKKAFAIGDLGFDFACLCVAERISQRFARNAVDVVAKDWMQVPRRALYRNAKRRRAASAITGAAEFFTQRGQSLRQFVGNGCGGTQILNRIATFDDGLVGSIESLFESFLRFAGRKQIVYRLKMEHQPLKTLQQRVVQFPGDAGSFGQALFKSQGELGFRQLAHSGHHCR